MIQNTASGAKAKDSSEPKSPWLHAHHDQLAGLKAYTSCVACVDMEGNGEYRLLVADLDKKLKVFRGTTMVSEHALLDVPVALCSFYTDDLRPRTPAVGVAAGPFVFIYRNLRPYFKFCVPPVEIAEVELDIWRQLKEEQVEIATAHEMLTATRDAGTQLSSRSLDLLAIEDSDQQMAYVEQIKADSRPHKQDTVITCMATMFKVSDELDAISSLVIGTESRLVIILDPPATTKLCQVELPSAPTFMCVHGSYTVDWRIVCACRDGRIYTVTVGDHRGTAVIRRPHIELETQPCGLALMGQQKFIYVGTMDQQLHCYHTKGKKAFSLCLPANITNLECLSVRKNVVTSALLVALSNGEIRIYREKALVDVLSVGGVVTALNFGPYGREENSLVVIQKSGALTIKMLQRSANLNTNQLTQGPPKEQDQKLDIPKKTMVYVEQTQREKEMAVDMHRIFQRDLCKLRLHVARSYVKLITDGELGVTPAAGGASITLNAQVTGLGPFFRLKIDARNGGTRALAEVPLIVVYHHATYTMARSTAMLPVLLPGVSVHTQLEIECVDENLPPQPLKVLLLDPNQSSVPLVSSLVVMPQSELLDEA